MYHRYKHVSHRRLKDFLFLLGMEAGFIGIMFTAWLVR